MNENDSKSRWWSCSSKYSRRAGHARETDRNVSLLSFKFKMFYIFGQKQLIDMKFEFSTERCWEYKFKKKSYLYSVKRLHSHVLSPYWPNTDVSSADFNINATISCYECQKIFSKYDIIFQLFPDKNVSYKTYFFNLQFFAKILSPKVFWCVFTGPYKGEKRFKILAWCCVFNWILVFLNWEI